jgi:hypothetical protein
MRAHDLESRIGKLEKGLPSFSQELRFAFGYIEPDAASSLTKSRIVLEKLLVQVYTVEMGHEPRKPLLGDMLVDNQFTRRIERRILSRMNGIRDIGNLGPHGEAVEPNDAARALDDLCEVLEWYVLRYRSTEHRDSPAANLALLENVKGDKEALEHLYRFFDRPAFRHPFHYECDLKAFNCAMEDTTQALNTGILKTREGSLIAKSLSRHDFHNPSWKKVLEAVEQLMGEIRQRFTVAVRVGILRSSSHGLTFSNSKGDGLMLISSTVGLP